MKITNISKVTIIAASLAVLGGVALAAQDRSALKIPDGLAFAEFKGYDTWQTVAVSATENSIKVIVANPTMIARLQGWHSRQRQTVPRRLQSREDRMGQQKNPVVALFRGSSRRSEDARVY
ncbi:MAG: hypothetical protein WDM89_20530 [Rhizomicrobium sp.]